MGKCPKNDFNEKLELDCLRKKNSNSRCGEAFVFVRIKRERGRKIVIHGVERHLCLYELKGKGKESAFRICSRKPSLEFFGIFFVPWKINQFFHFFWDTEDKKFKRRAKI